MDNIYQNENSTVLIGERYYSKFAGNLNTLGYNVLKIPENPALDQRVSSHVDMSILKVSDHMYFAADYLKNSVFADYAAANDITVHYIEFNDCKNYPGDCLLNVLILNKFAIFNPKCIASDLLDYFQSHDYTLIHVKQGYTKCSCAIVNDRAIITSDPGIYAALENYPVEVLLIDSGFIYLEGFDYGFIGGASVKDEKRKVLMLTGKINDSTSRNRIRDFLKRYNTDIIELTDDSISDIGGIISG